VKVEVIVGGRRPALAPDEARRVAEAVLRGEDREASLSLTFLGRESMRRLNKKYKGHDRPTDVLAFTLPGPDGTVVGDVYLCRHVAQRNARTHGVPLREELVRLIVHGTLHVLGYDHPEEKSRTDSEMWRRQEAYVRELT